MTHFGIFITIGNENLKNNTHQILTPNACKSERTCQQVFGCFLDKIYCVNGEGSSSYLSKGRFSMTSGSEFVQVNLTFGWADLGGNTLAVTSGQKDSGIGQKPLLLLDVVIAKK